MKRERNGGIQGIAMKVAGAFALVGTGILAFTQWPSVRRYLHIRRMSGRAHAVPAGHTDPDAGTPRWGTTHWPLR